MESCLDRKFGHRKLLAKTESCWSQQLSVPGTNLPGMKVSESCWDQIWDRFPASCWHQLSGPKVAATFGPKVTGNFGTGCWDRKFPGPKVVGSTLLLGPKVAVPDRKLLGPEVAVTGKFSVPATFGPGQVAFGPESTTLGPKVLGPKVAGTKFWDRNFPKAGTETLGPNFLGPKVAWTETGTKSSDRKLLGPSNFAGTESCWDRKLLGPQLWDRLPESDQLSVLGPKIAGNESNFRSRKLLGPTFGC